MWQNSIILSGALPTYTRLLDASSQYVHGCCITHPDDVHRQKTILLIANDHPLFFSIDRLTDNQSFPLDTLSLLRDKLHSERNYVNTNRHYSTCQDTRCQRD